MPPQKLEILDRSGRHVITSAGPVVEGASLTLTCFAVGGRYIIIIFNKFLHVFT